MSRGELFEILTTWELEAEIEKHIVSVQNRRLRPETLILELEDIKNSSHGLRREYINMLWKELGPCREELDPKKLYSALKATGSKFREAYK